MHAPPVKALCCVDESSDGQRDWNTSASRCFVPETPYKRPQLPFPTNWYILTATPSKSYVPWAGVGTHQGEGICSLHNKLSQPEDWTLSKLSHTRLTNSTKGTNHSHNTRYELCSEGRTLSMGMHTYYYCTWSATFQAVLSMPQASLRRSLCPDQKQRAIHAWSPWVKWYFLCRSWTWCLIFGHPSVAEGSENRGPCSQHCVCKEWDF